MTPREVRENVVGCIEQVLTTSRPPVRSAQIDSWIYDALCEMWQQAQPVHALSGVFMDINVSNVHYFPSNMFVLERVLVYDDGEWCILKRSTRDILDDVGWENGVVYGVPCFYETGLETAAGTYYGQRKFALNPAPSAAVTNGLEVRYLRLPTKVSAMPSDQHEIIDVPAMYHKGIVSYCVMNALGQLSKKDINPDSIAFHKDRWDTQRSLFCRENQKKQADFSDTIPMTIPQGMKWNGMDLA